MTKPMTEARLEKCLQNFCKISDEEWLPELSSSQCWALEEMETEIRTLLKREKGYLSELADYASEIAELREENGY